MRQQPLTRPPAPFAGFEDYWETIALAPSAGKQLADLSRTAGAKLTRRLLARMPAHQAAGRSGSVLATSL